MKTIAVNDQEKHLLQALLSKGPMTDKELTALCKNAFGWSGAVVRRTKKALLKQELAKVESNRWTALVTKQDLEDQNWSQWVENTFEWSAPPQPEAETKQPAKSSIWFWTTCIAAALVIVLGVLLLLPTPKPDIPEQLQVCKDALAQWQSHDSYYIQQTTFYQLGIFPNHPHLQQRYYVHGEEWMSLCIDRNMPNSTQYSSYVYHGSNLYYCQNLNTQLWHKDTKHDPDEFAPKPWPMTFTWENCDLIYRSIIQDTQEALINVQIVDRSNETTDVYNVTFYLDKDSHLTCVQITTIQPDQLIRTDLYTLESYDPDVIAEAIINQVKTK